MADILETTNNPDDISIQPKDDRVDRSGDVDDEEESESATVFKPKWRKKYIADYCFAKAVGPAIDSSDENELYEGDIFNTLLGEDIYELLVFQTNLYATQKQKPFFLTNDDEITAFISLNFLMGVKKMPFYNDC